MTRFGRWLPITVFALFTALFFWKITFSDQYSMICLQDWGIQFYPWFHFSAYEIQNNHVLPLWDPFSLSGRNFVGEMQTGIFYPWNWFVFLGPMGKMLSVDWVQFWILLSFVWGAWGMYRCARHFGLDRSGSTVAGLVFVFAGELPRRAMAQVNIFNGALWMPVVLLFFSKALRQKSVRQQFKFTLLAGGAWGLSFIAGHHESGLFIGLGVAFWTLLYVIRPAGAAGRKSALVLLIFLTVFAFLAAAVQLIPAYQYSKSAYRWAGAVFGPGQEIPLEQLETTQQLEPRSLFSLIFPLVDAKGESAIYFGILPLLLAVYGSLRCRRLGAWRFAALAAFALLYSFSGFSMVHGLLASALPLLRMARAHSRIVWLFHFAVAMLAGAGAGTLLQELNRGDRRALRKLCRAWGVWVAAAGLLLGALTLAGIYLPRLTATGEPLPLSTLYYAWIMMAVAFGLLRWRLTRRRPSWIFAVLGLVALLLDLTPANTTAIIPRAGADRVVNYFPYAIYRSPELLMYTEALKQEGRWEDQASMFALNFQLIHRIRATGGYSATAPAAYMDYLWKGGRTRDQLNVRYQFIKNAQGAPVMTERLGSIPRFQLTRNVRILADADLMTWLESGEYRPDTAVVDASERDKLPDAVMMLSRQAAQMTGTVKLLWENNRRIEMDVNSLLPAFLLTSETYDVGWSAYVDRREVPVVRCNGILRGVWLPAGSHRVSFRYIPAGLYQGATFSTLYWLGLAGAAYAFRRGGALAAGGGDPGLAAKSG